MKLYAKKKYFESVKTRKTLTGKVSLHYEIESDCPNVLFFQTFSDKRYNLCNDYSTKFFTFKSFIVDLY